MLPEQNLLDIKSAKRFNAMLKKCTFALFLVSLLPVPVEER